MNKRSRRIERSPVYRWTSSDLPNFFSNGVHAFLGTGDLHHGISRTVLPPPSTVSEFLSATRFASPLIPSAMVITGTNPCPTAETSMAMASTSHLGLFELNTIIVALLALTLLVTGMLFFWYHRRMASKVASLSSSHAAFLSRYTSLSASHSSFSSIHASIQQLIIETVTNAQTSVSRQFNSATAPQHRMVPAIIGAEYLGKSIAEITLDLLCRGMNAITDALDQLSTAAMIDAQNIDDKDAEIRRLRSELEQVKNDDNRKALEKDTEIRRLKAELEQIKIDSNQKAIEKETEIRGLKSELERVKKDGDRKGVEREANKPANASTAVAESQHGSTKSVETNDSPADGGAAIKEKGTRAPEKTGPPIARPEKASIDITAPGKTAPEPSNQDRIGQWKAFASEPRQNKMSAETVVPSPAASKPSAQPASPSTPKPVEKKVPAATPQSAPSALAVPAARAPYGYIMNPDFIPGVSKPSETARYLPAPLEPAPESVPSKPWIQPLPPAKVKAGWKINPDYVPGKNERYIPPPGTPSSAQSAPASKPTAQPAPPAPPKPVEKPTEAQSPLPASSVFTEARAPPAGYIWNPNYIPGENSRLLPHVDTTPFVQPTPPSRMKWSGPPPPAAAAPPPPAKPAAPQPTTPSKPAPSEKPTEGKAPARETRGFREDRPPPRGYIWNPNYVPGGEVPRLLPHVDTTPFVQPTPPSRRKGPGPRR
ncbi:MAG: hypothetical protein Q9191_001799 [Dirinaria sp. TL-2023a]